MINLLFLIFKDLNKWKKIGVPKNYAYVEELKKIYPNINYVEVPTIKMV